MPDPSQQLPDKRAEQRATYERVVQRELQRSDDGLSYVKAMGRMGMDELAEALKAFPDSIGIQHEPGGPWETTQQEVYQSQGGYLELQQSKIQIPEQQKEQQKEP